METINVILVKDGVHEGTVSYQYEVGTDENQVINKAEKFFGDVIVTKCGGISEQEIETALDEGYWQSDDETVEVFLTHAIAEKDLLAMLKS